MEGKNVEDVPYFQGPLDPAEWHWFCLRLLWRADTGVISIQRDLWKEYSLKWIFSRIWRGSVPLDTIRLKRVLWPRFLRRSLTAALMKRGPKAGCDFYRGLAQFLNEDSGWTPGLFFQGQASCVSLGVFNNHILKKEPPFLLNLLRLVRNGDIKNKASQNKGQQGKIHTFLTATVHAYWQHSC